MSRIGKKPVPIPAGVKVDVSGQVVKVAGPKGSLSWSVPSPITAKVDAGTVVLNRPNDERQSKALHGLSRALIANMITGASKGYEIGMEVYGTGYSAKLAGKKLLLNLGYMGRGVGKQAQFVLDIPPGLEVQVTAEAARGETEPAKFVVRGADKQVLGQFCAEIRKLRKPEPYKGKGVRYAGERIRRKVGKALVGGAA